MKKIGVILLSICMIFPIFGTISNAASGSVSISNASATVGKNVTITCTVSCTTAIGYANVVLTYDQSALKFISGTNMAQGGSGSVRYVDAGDGSAKKLSFQMTFQILKVGSYKVSTSSVTASDFNENQYNPGSATGTITGKAQTTNNNTNNNNNNSNSNNNNNHNSNSNTTQNNKDSNNKLNSLQVYPGSLAPTFSADTTSYRVNVPEDTTAVTISAAAQSSKASVTVSGGTNLKLGENTAQVVVVAENGSSRAYSITIVCGEKEQISIGNVNHTINEAFTDDQIPVGFTRTKLTYNKRQYEGLVNGSNTLQLISLQNDAGAGYYIYDQKTQEFYTFVQIPIAEGKYIIPLPLSNEITEFAKAQTVSLNVQNKTFDAWKLDEEFSVVYAMNQEGTKVLYRYDSIDGVFQRYTDATVEVDGEAGKKLLFPNEYYMYAIVGLGSLVVILSIAMIYFIASRRHRHEGRKRRAIRKQEKLLAKEEKRREKEERAVAKQRAIDEKAAAKQRAIDEKAAAKQRAIDEKEAEKQRAAVEKQRLKEEKKLAKQRRKEK